jgi:DNA mismatch endonuclease (patch repair protein)
MTDVFTSKKRSEVMSLIRSKGNMNTEIRLLRLLRVARISGWRRHLRLPGTPDFAFRESKLAIFTDGCFWHGCSRCQLKPKSNSQFWADKIDRNRRRDRRVNKELRVSGWTVVRVRECVLERSPQKVAILLKRCLTGLADAARTAAALPR